MWCVEYEIIDSRRYPHCKTTYGYSKLFDTKEEAEEEWFKIKQIQTPKGISLRPFELTNIDKYTTDWKPVIKDYWVAIQEAIGPCYLDII